METGLYIIVAISVTVIGLIMDFRNARRHELHMTTVAEQVRSLELTTVHHHGKMETALAIVDRVLEEYSKRLDNLETQEGSMSASQGESILDQLGKLSTNQVGIAMRCNALESRLNDALGVTDEDSE